MTYRNMRLESPENVEFARCLILLPLSLLRRQTKGIIKTTEQ